MNKFEKAPSPEATGESRAELEAKKGWSPESDDFWHMGVKSQEAEKAEEADKVHIEGLEGNSWDPMKYEKGIGEYAKERGLDEKSAVAEASYLLAGKPEDIEKMKYMLKSHLPNVGAQLLNETRDILKAGGDSKEAWRKLKLKERIEKLKISLEKEGE